MINLDLKYSDYLRDIYLLSKSGRTLVVIKEGDGSNLWPEDRDAGYEDYWLVEAYSIDTHGNSDEVTVEPCVETGQIMEPFIIQEHGYTIRSILEELDLNPDDFYVLCQNQGEELEGKLEAIENTKVEAMSLVSRIVMEEKEVA